MDDLQYHYVLDWVKNVLYIAGFKPCYKWMTFNTSSEKNGEAGTEESFKPCYKWMTFNTYMKEIKDIYDDYLKF